MSQTARNYRVAFKVQSALDDLPTATGATRLRMLASPGMNEESPPIVSEEERADLQPQQGRMGSRSTSGTYEAEASLGSHDAPLEALMRGTWAPAAEIDETDVGQITVDGSAITAATGSWLDEGIRVGDVVTLSGTDVTANNNRVLRVTGVTPTVLTVAETLAEIAAASDFDLRIARKLINPSTVVRRLFTLEQFYADINRSILFRDTRWVGAGINVQASALKRFSFQTMGRRMEVREAVGPYFTSPTAPSTIPIVTVDGALRFGGSDVAIATGLTLDLSLDAQTVGVVGDRLSPDVYDGGMSVSGQITAIRADLQQIERYLAEEELELHVMFRTPGVEPRPFMSLFAGNVKLGSPQAPLGGNGPMIETAPLIFGVKGAETGYEETTLKWCTSFTP